MGFEADGKWRLWYILVGVSRLLLLDCTCFESARPILQRMGLETAVSTSWKTFGALATWTGGCAVAAEMNGVAQNITNENT
jgi:hypothetical protein